MESVVDLTSIPSAYSTQSSEDDEDTGADGPAKRPRREADPDEVTSSLSGSGHKEKSSEPIFITPLASMPPPTRMFSLNTRYSNFNPCLPKTIKRHLPNLTSVFLDPRRPKPPPVPKAQPSSSKGATATASTAAPKAPPAQPDPVPEHVVEKPSGTPSSSGKGALHDDLDQQVRQTAHTRTSSLLEGIDMSDIDKSTLASDFQVGRHVSLLFFITLMSNISSGARPALLIGVAPESAFDCMQSSSDSISVSFYSWLMCFAYLAVRPRSSVLDKAVCGGAPGSGHCSVKLGECQR